VMAKVNATNSALSQSLAALTAMSNAIVSGK
jgi:hypothetical protein